MTKALIVPNVTMEDKGTYLCIASIIAQSVVIKKLQLSTKVTVYGEDVMLCHYLNILMFFCRTVGIYLMYFLSVCLYRTSIPQCDPQ